MFGDKQDNREFTENVGWGLEISKITDKLGLRVGNKQDYKRGLAEVL